MSPAATSNRSSAEIIVAGIPITDKVVVISGQNPCRNLPGSGWAVVEHHYLLWFVLSGSNYPHMALPGIAVFGFLIKDLHGRFVAVHDIGFVFHGFQHVGREGLHIVLVSPENPVAHGLPGKRKAKPLPFLFLTVFRKSQLELFVEYL